MSHGLCSCCSGLSGALPFNIRNNHKKVFFGEAAAPESHSLGGGEECGTTGLIYDDIPWPALKLRYERSLVVFLVISGQHPL